MAAKTAQGSAPFQEIEAKFRIDDVEAAEDLRRVPSLAGRFPLGKARRVTHVDTYFDTLDQRLLRAGRTFRTRVVGGAVLVTAKSLGEKTLKGVHARAEIEVRSELIESTALTLDLAQIPPEVAQSIAEWVNPGEELVALVRLEQVRTVRPLYFSAGDSAPLAELSVDEVVVLRTGTTGWEAASRFCEMEIELLDPAQSSALWEVAQAARTLPGVALDSGNKLQHALLALAELPISADAPADHRLHVAELCRRIWKQQLAQMMLHEAGVRFSKDIEYVHQMRVATRRARAAARLYAAYFEKKNKRIKRFERDLRTTGRLLGSVRDLDVALENLDRHAAEDGNEKDKGFQNLRQHWKQMRKKAHGALLDWLDSPRYEMFVGDLDRFCNAPGEAVAPWAPVAGEPPEPHQVRHVIPGQILLCYEEIRAFEVLFESGNERAKGLSDVPVETLHALRIKCKYLRYHLEFNSVLLGTEGEELIDTLKRLQEQLGILNDASVGMRMLSEAGKSKRGPLLRRYHAELEATVADMRSILPAELTSFLSEETRQRLLAAVARI